MKPQTEGRSKNKNIFWNRHHPPNNGKNPTNLSRCIYIISEIDHEDIQKNVMWVYMGWHVFTSNPWIFRPKNEFISLAPGRKTRKPYERSRSCWFLVHFFGWRFHSEDVNQIIAQKGGPRPEPIVTSRVTTPPMRYPCIIRRFLGAKNNSMYITGSIRGPPCRHPTYSKYSVRRCDWTLRSWTLGDVYTPPHQVFGCLG